MPQARSSSDAAPTSRPSAAGRSRRRSICRPAPWPLVGAHPLAVSLAHLDDRVSPLVVDDVDPRMTSPLRATGGEQLAAIEGGAPDLPGTRSRRRAPSPARRRARRGRARKRARVVPLGTRGGGAPIGGMASLIHPSTRRVARAPGRRGAPRTGWRAVRPGAPLRAAASRKTRHGRRRLGARKRRRRGCPAFAARPAAHAGALCTLRRRRRLGHRGPMRRLSSAPRRKIATPFPEPAIGSRALATRALLDEEASKESRRRGPSAQLRDRLDRRAARPRSRSPLSAASPHSGRSAGHRFLDRLAIAR